MTSFFRFVDKCPIYRLGIISLAHAPVQRAAKRNFGPQGKRKLGPPPPILQIMILKLSPPRCVISKESAQQK